MAIKKIDEKGREFDGETSFINMLIGFPIGIAFLFFIGTFVYDQLRFLFTWGVGLILPISLKEAPFKWYIRLVLLLYNIIIFLLLANLFFDDNSNAFLYINLLLILMLTFGIAISIYFAPHGKLIKLIKAEKYE